MKGSNIHILETRGLTHDFQGLVVLSDVNLEVREGERHAIIGPNGAGKTTLFNVITGTYRPSRGRVFYEGQDITGVKPVPAGPRGPGSLVSDHQHLPSTDGLSRTSGWRSSRAAGFGST